MQELVSLYQLTIESKKANEEAIEKIIKIFTPKVKKTLLQTNMQYREDLEQELQLKIINLIKMYDIEQVVGFWGFYDLVKSKYS